MKFLCVCYYGHSRSVAMVRSCHKYKQEHSPCDLDAVAVGVGMTAVQSVDTFCKWADKILLMKADLMHYIPMEHRHKVELTDVGEDRWSNPYHPELGAICDKLLAGILEKQ